MFLTQKAPDRAFKIRIKPRLDESADKLLTLSVSLPATYPKTLPKLVLDFSENMNVKTQIEAQDVLRTKTKSLLGTEMIFEIATSLQDVLDQELPQIKPVDVKALDEERAIQEAANARKAQQIEEERKKEQVRARIEEEQALSQMMEHEKTRLAKRKGKVPNALNNANNEEDTPRALSFDQPVPVKNPKGTVIMLRTVYSKILYREGPATTISTVQPWARHEGDDSITQGLPFLVLQECRIESQKNEEIVKKHIQNLETRLDRLKNLG